MSTLPATMRAMVMERIGGPLRLCEVPVPRPQAGELLVRVTACGVCRTDLHVFDGDLPHPTLPLIPGHEVVGTITALGDGVDGLMIGQRVGIPWLGWTCGDCAYCLAGQENLCVKARFTGYTLNGGYAEFTVADYRYVFPLPEEYTDAEAAPLLCAGLIGHRSYRKAGKGKNIGLYGFGAAAHIAAQVARHEGRRVFAFVRPEDAAAAAFARELGARWVGPSDALPPEPLDAAILYAPAGALVPAALKAVHPGGIVVCAGIHMTDIPGFPYSILWGERCVCSVANLTRQDAVEFLELATEVPIKVSVELFPLEQANEALNHLRAGTLRGAAVLMSNPL